MIRFDGIAIDRKAGVISAPGGSCRLLRQRLRLAEALLLAGPRTRAQLFDLMYGGNEDGGPLCGTELLDVMLSHLKPKLLAIGIAIRDSGTYGAVRTYWAELEQASGRRAA